MKKYSYLLLGLVPIGVNAKTISTPNIDEVNESYFVYILGALVLIIGLFLVRFINKQHKIKKSGRKKLSLREEHKNDLKYKRAYVSSILMILAGILILIGKVGYVFYDNQRDKNSISEFYEKESEESIDPETDVAELDENGNVINNTKYDYVMVLKIPKIGFERGLVSKDSKYNTVAKNIQIIAESDMPDKENGNLILAGHSGNSRISFFRRLVEVGVGDEVIVDYNGKTYKYIINNTYDIPKTGQAEIVRDSNKTTLTLITCRQGTYNQVVMIAYLDSVA